MAAPASNLSADTGEWLDQIQRAADALIATIEGNTRVSKLFLHLAAEAVRGAVTLLRTLAT